ncbi:hypothetical protein VKS41_008099 [Umbelopsis sp. WA50703]
MDIAQQSAEHTMPSSTPSMTRMDSPQQPTTLQHNLPMEEDMNGIASNNLAAQLASQFARYNNSTKPTYYSTDEYTMSTTNDVIDRSTYHNVEKVIEVGPNGRYARLNTLLGKGAYKIVYKGIDREEGYEVAWNIFSQPATTDNQDLSHEIEILKSVRHPNIIAFHDAWSTNNEFVFITELMTSGTLRDYIRKLSLPNNKIVKRWSRQILKGLVYLHSHQPPIIHRDIKCDNIFINGAHGEVKIGDLGTAQENSPLMSSAKRYTVIGTPEFMAPEMYEEKGYSEKVDIYAFGMCLLEMVTGEYPYGECKNAAQIYKKVIQNIKPECLSKVQDEEVLALVNSCLSPEHERMSAQEILEHSFLAVEPEVVLVGTDNTKKHLHLLVVFKGMEKLSVKFEFNADSDTADEVVSEMIEEQVLPQRYQQLITGEINRILRDMSKDSGVQDKNAARLVWRREYDYQSELEQTRMEIVKAEERALEAQKRCEELELQASIVEERFTDTVRKMTTIETEEHMDSPVETGSTHAVLMEHVLAKYADEDSIEGLVMAAATATNRGRDKATEWVHKLHDQDIMTVGDLRGLHDEDWAGLGLTVFALRALKNTLKGKRPSVRSNSISDVEVPGSIEDMSSAVSSSS